MVEPVDIEVALGARSYPVCLRPSLTGLGAAVRGATGASGVVLVTESTVGPLWSLPCRSALEADGLAVSEVVLPAGEDNKTLQTFSACVDGLLAARVDRRTAVVALGGGVLGDVAGFAAASTLRGLPLVQVPTTVLSMVDSSVGGKTAVNHPSGKNLIGAFHQPALVWVATETLTTLAAVERVAGLGEVLKTALIAGEQHLASVERDAAALRAGEPDALLRQVAGCVRAKADVVGRDEREQGVRAWLNLGHTAGHGLEAALGYGVLRHGEAVSLGLVSELRWAAREGLCEQVGLAERVERLAVALGLPAQAPAFDEKAAVTAMRLDKKARGAMVHVPVCVRPGHLRIVDVPHARLSELLPR